jgi:S-methylmethionine-dependent homocysteine/selenocysteine methylase
LFSLYSGNYGDAITLETLKDFHRRRVQILAESGADLIAFETVPNKVEAQVLIESFVMLRYLNFLLLEECHDQI